MKRRLGAVFMLCLAWWGVLLILFITGCGKVDVSDSKHEVGGTGTLRIEIDLAICDQLPEADKPQCIKDVLEILRTTQEVKDDSKG